jgi:Ca-activated chloride channel family protein
VRSVILLAFISFSAATLVVARQGRGEGPYSNARCPRPAPGGLTALYDAGGDNASRRTLDDVLQIAQRSSATIYTIGIYDETDLDRNPRALQKIARLSGGRAYFPDSVKDLEQVWRDIAGGIRSQYTIGYHSSNPKRDGGFRKVKITTGPEGRGSLRVTTRDGYFASTDRSIP